MRGAQALSPELPRPQVKTPPVLVVQNGEREGHPPRLPLSRGSALPSQLLLEPAGRPPALTPAHGDRPVSALGHPCPLLPHT